MSTRPVRPGMRDPNLPPMRPDHRDPALPDDLDVDELGGIDPPENERRWLPVTSVAKVAVLVGLLAVVALVSGALFGDKVLEFTQGWRGGGEAERVNLPTGARVVFAGEPASLQAAAGNVVEPGVRRSDGPTAIIRTKLATARLTGATDGVSVRLNSPLVQEIAGKRVRVTVWARRPEGSGDSPFAVAYSAAQFGNSGWIVFTPSGEFAPYRFDMRVPARPPDATAVDHIGIWSDISGRGAALELRRITIEVIR